MKNKYKIYYGILMILVITIFIGLFKVLEIKDVTIDEIRNDILQSTDVTTMDVDDGSKLRKLYNINKRDVDDFILYAPKSNMEANEILILKAKTQDDLKSLKEKVNHRVKSQSDSFENYDKIQFEIISNYILEDKDKYLILIISKDYKAIKKSIDESF